MKKMALYPGTFDPITNGHLEMVVRASVLFDEVIVAVAQDVGRSTLFPFETRLQLAQTSLKGLPGVRVKGFKGLLVDFYQAEGAQVLVRGVRSAKDFEYEYELMQINQHLLKNVETLFLMPSQANRFISASMVREIARLGGDVSAFVPTPVLKALG